ncbi:hypothetical protein LRS13_13780 [Svornostia abyssi]|uniref:Uncharacterized protein n=1 Tax=Svornostia abyssi TaxID=2898438 RepID=A0ABY5PAU2_9ACTN|nr:hypothetical protein LRS13_13780 [Parviterribacteraceae bacterium J379]
MSGDIHDFEAPNGTIAYFAIAYADERTSKSAWDRGAKVIKRKDDVSAFRFIREDGTWTIAVLAADRRRAKRASERVAWGGHPCVLSEAEVSMLANRFVEVFEQVGSSSGIDASASWQGVGGISLGPEGTRGPIRRPQG